MPTEQATLEFGEALKTEAAAVRVRHERMGIRRTLNGQQLRQAAETFNADHRLLMAAKKLIDTKHPLWRKVMRIRCEATRYWRALTTPFPEPGIRLIRKAKIVQFEHDMNLYKQQLAAAVAELQAVYADLRAEAQQRLGTLFNAADYPARIDTEFSLEWEYPSFEPPKYLQEISPALYAEQEQRIKRRFDEAVELAEAAFMTEFSKLVAHLAERLAGQEDGKPKTFRDSAVVNLREFFDRFGELNIGSNDKLDGIVNAARKMLNGVAPDELRNDASLRQDIAGRLGEVKTAVDDMMEDRPVRQISFLDDE